MGEPEWQAIRRVIESGWVTQGPKVAEFEHDVAQFCGAEHAVAVSSCTAALHLSLLVAGIGPGDEVIVPSMSFIATANAVVHSGATPVFAEVEPDTFNLVVSDVSERITPLTRAIIVVHQLGLPAEIAAFEKLAAAHSLHIIEDAACAIGSTYHGAPIGSHADLVCLSFHPRKLVTTGDGGMVLARRQEDAERLRHLRQHGMSVSDRVRNASSSVVRESYLEVAYNYRMTDIQAAMGIEQLRRLPGILERRRELSECYNAAFVGHPVISTPPVPENVTWNVQSYAVRLFGASADQRDRVMQLMLDEGIATRPGVMTAHREPAYAELSVRLPVSEAASDSSMLLPLFSQMTDADLDECAAALKRAVAATGLR
jgi:dTDP-4-amino-4,6-dideoxygalactose transaminase